MGDFKVLEILDSNTIKVSPEWLYEVNDGDTITGSTVKILGFTVDPNNASARHRLTSLLRLKDVDLVNPIILQANSTDEKIIGCNVLIDKTDISYYFPEFKKEIA